MKRISTLEPRRRGSRVWQTDRQTDRRADGWTDGQTFWQQMPANWGQKNKNRRMLRGNQTPCQSCPFLIWWICCQCQRCVVW